MFLSDIHVTIGKMKLTMEDFLERHCEGKQYDSCANTPCKFASPSGCTHPRHPKN